VHLAVSQREIESLYERFRTLDKGRKGYIHADELLGIPELSINPILSRLGRLFESVNFKEFVKLLAPFSARASRDDKLEAMFLIYDVDGDGEASQTLKIPPQLHFLIHNGRLF
jgi:serine/threonine-protein phosphatase 2B regulatory subunit